MMLDEVDQKTEAKAARRRRRRRPAETLRVYDDAKRLATYTAPRRI